MTNRSLRLSMVSAAVGILLAAGIASPASAASSGVEDLVGPGESFTKTDRSTGLTTGVSLGKPATVTLDEITKDASLSRRDRTELLDAASRGAVRSNHWTQWTTGIAYTNTQDGTFYYNGSRVWVTQTYGGKRGSQRCFTNYVVSPYEISKIQKSDSGSTASRSLKCSWNVKQGVFPVTTSWSMTATVSKSGGISGLNASKG